MGLESTGLSDKIIDRFRRERCPECVVRNDAGHIMKSFDRFMRLQRRGGGEGVVIY